MEISQRTEQKAMKFEAMISVMFTDISKTRKKKQFHREISITTKQVLPIDPINL